MTPDDLAAHAQAILDTNSYLTLSTVDPDGNPWTSPVYFAAGPLGEFYWLSATEAEHSRNLAEHPQVSLVVFDSTVLPYHGRAVYAAGEARELSGDDLDRGVELYPGADSRGASAITRDDVSGSSPYRLYRVKASGLWVLCPRDSRQPCYLHGLAKDHRAPVPIA
jgi:nitroimidazol reductase NimA-like FMN-containing flavoprotein (pyridoxamine 5'-phosphate oxidase superfamily)